MEQTSEPIGVALRQARRRLGLSQRELAARAGVSERSVRNIECGRVGRPSGDSLRRIAQIVGLEPEPLAGAGAVRVGVLGPLAVRYGSQPADVGPSKQRCLLGLLALQPGSFVGIEEIVDALWGEDPPSSCVNLVHTYASRLRRSLAALQPDDAAVRIGSARGGYRLIADAGALDVLRFDELAARARRSEGSEAVELFEQALDCWRGPVLADLPAGVRQHPAAVAVAERQVAVALAYADAALEVGRYAAVVDRVGPLAQRHELHEGLHARLMLALAGSGQQAAALRVFDEVRRRLDEELGVEPGAELRDAQLRVLRGESPKPRASHPIPAQLPADVGGFVGREEDLARLDALLADPAGALVISSIDGMPGIGKTALAVHWAHRVSDRFPDGQLYINLRGYDRSAPVQPQQALARFLRALGVPAGQIPADEDEAASLFRTRLAGKRVLVVLDNASSVEQVAPLLPGTSSCLVLVTSRDRLSELAATHGARRVNLDVLAPEDAHALVAGMIGARRADAEPAAVGQLARSCGYVPLVLRVAAANLSVQSHSSAADYVSDMRERGRITDGDAVRAAFDLSFERLNPAARAVFPLLGLAPGDFTPDAVAALADTPVADARAVLQQLCAASLLQEYTAGRYRLHDLLRDYAAARAGQLPEDARTTAAARMLDFYLRSVDAATRLLYPNVLRMPLPDAQQPHVVSFASGDAALAWLDGERGNVVEVVANALELGVPDYAWRLVDALRGYLLTRGYNTEGMAVCRSALEAARAVLNQEAEGSVLDALGLVYYNLSDYARATEVNFAALALSRQTGIREAEANSLHNQGRVYSQLGKPVEARRCYHEAMTIWQSLGNVAGEFWALNYIGAAALSQADLRAAADHSERALQLAGSLGDYELQLRAQHLKALTLWAGGHLVAAERAYGECLRIAPGSGNRHIELAVLVCLAETKCDAGRYEEAEELARDALTLGRSLGEGRHESGSLEVLASALHYQGRHSEAEQLALDALQKARDIKFLYGENSVLISLATMLRTGDRASEARARCATALELMRESGSVMLESRALTELALADLTLQRLDEAAASAAQALALARERGQRLAEARALRALGWVRRAQGDVSGATGYLQHAAEMFRKTGSSETVDR